MHILVFVDGLVCDSFVRMSCMCLERVPARRPHCLLDVFMCPSVVLGLCWRGQSWLCVMWPNVIRRWGFAIILSPRSCLRCLGSKPIECIVVMSYGQLFGHWSMVSVSRFVNNMAFNVDVVGCLVFVLWHVFSFWVGSHWASESLLPRSPLSHPLTFLEMSSSTLRCWVTLYVLFLNNVVVSCAWFACSVWLCLRCLLIVVIMRFVYGASALFPTCVVHTCS